jgi:hypothetical protein
LKALIETTNKRPERVFLVGLELKSRASWEVKESLDGLGNLIRAAGTETVMEDDQFQPGSSEGDFDWLSDDARNPN